VFIQDPNARVHHEPAMDLVGAECELATDYNKRPHVFRLRLATGGEFLFMAKDQVTEIITFSQEFSFVGCNVLINMSLNFKILYI